MHVLLKLCAGRKLTERTVRAEALIALKSGIPLSITCVNVYVYLERLNRDVPHLSVSCDPVLGLGLSKSGLRNSR